jgi:hypothetical protein
MLHVAFGLISVVCASGLPLLYLVYRQLRRVVAWMDNNPPPKERAGAYVVVLALLGLLAGSVLQWTWDATAPCRANGGALVACALKFHPAPPQQ